MIRILGPSYSIDADLDNKKYTLCINFEKKSHIRKHCFT